MQTLLQDLRYAVRQLLKNPGFSTVAVLTLALGIGAATTIFTVVNRVLIEPLPYKGGDRLVFLTRFNPKAGMNVAPSPEWITRWRTDAQSFEAIEAYASRRLTLTKTGEPELMSVALMSPDLLSFLGVAPVIGRPFGSHDVQRGAEKTVLIGYQLWQNRFGKDPSVLGRSLTLDHQRRTVVGVLPRGFQFPAGDTQIWLPLSLGAESESPSLVTAIARLKPDVSLARAQAEMDLISARAGLGEAQPDWKTLVSFPGAHPSLGRALMVLLGATGMILLIACANISNLLLGRGVSRGRELAIRSTLGAGRFRLVRQLLVESLVLASLGALAGLLVSSWGLQLTLALRPDEIRGFVDPRMDERVLAFSVLVSVLAGLLFGLTPAWRLSRSDVSEMLKAASATHTGGRGQHALRSALVSGEIAVCMVLLIGAALLVRSFLELQRVDLGFDPDGLWVIGLTLPKERYPQSQRELFLEEARERIEELHGVRSASVAGLVPPRSSGLFGFGSLEIEGLELPEPDTPFFFSGGWVDRSYFETMRIPLLRGRSFTSDECFEASGVVVINEDTARRFWSLDQAVGKRLRFGRSESWRTIVGVVADAANQGPTQLSPGFQFYLPVREFFRQWDAELFSAFIVVRTEGDPESLVPSVGAQFRSVDPDLAVPEIATMQARLADSVARPRFNTVLLSIFAVLALVLALVGIYGVVSFWVSERVHEIGIRRALGAGELQIVAMVLKQGGRAAAAGIAVGVAGALAGTHVLSSLLFGVSATDPLTFIVLPLLFLTVACAACYIPARRAARVDPMVALRYE